MTEDSKSEAGRTEIEVSDILDKIQKDVDRTEDLGKIPPPSRMASMRYKIRGSLSTILLAVAVVIVLWFVLSRLRFFVFIPISLWGLMLTILGSIIVLFLVLDHFFNRL